MSLGLRYRGRFVGQDGNTWRVDLLCAGYSGVAAELTFPASKPLEIEWGLRGKEEVLCGSSATLTIESPGDRTFTDLYTVEAGSVVMEVYRADGVVSGTSSGTLYWRGTLDPEFYEEPYERAWHYDVMLTFQDFGILSRLRFNLSGTPTLGSILNDALERSQLGDLPIYASLSTKAGSVVPDSVLNQVCVNAANFYDEDGEALSLAEVLEGVLQPLGVKMVQRGGRLWLYDLNALAHGYDIECLPVEWTGSRQTLGVDRVANRVKVTWSPYARTDDLTDPECWVKDIDKTLTNLNNYLPLSHAHADGSYSRYWTIHASPDKMSGEGTSTDYGFTLWTNADGKGGTLLASEACFFKIVKHLSGEDCEGIGLLWGVGWTSPDAAVHPYDVPYYYGHGSASDHTRIEQNLFDPVSSRTPLFRSQGVSLPAVGDPSSLLLHITHELLLDVRFNPFESAVDFGDGGRQEKSWEALWKTHFNYVYVPVGIYFEGVDGRRYYWSRGLDLTYVEHDGEGSQCGRAETLEESYGRWLEYESVPLTPVPTGYLAWYSQQDRDNDCGILGWQKNRQMIMPNSASLSGLLSMLVDGQYIPYPPCTQGGTLTIEVFDGWKAYESGGTFTFNGRTYTRAYDVRSSADTAAYPGYIRWALLKLPSVEIVGSNVLDMSLQTDDVEYSGTINADAQDDVELETICGTSRDDRPTAVGIYLVGGAPVSGFERAGMSSTCEELLIRTLHSQWAERHVKLEGEMRERGEGLSLYSEAHQGARVFMKTGEVMDAIRGTTKATLVEVSADEYSRRVNN